MPGARIIIAEDEGIVALDLRLRLVAMGHQVVAWVTSGDQAVAHALGGNVDLLVMDVQLKGDVDGLEAVRRLRGASCPVPVLVLTAHAGLVSERTQADVAPCWCLSKPFDGDALSAAVEKLLT